MSAGGRRQIDRWTFGDWILTALYGAVLIFLLPHHVIARSDDFAYFEAVVRTVRTHFPGPSDWYEATNFLFSFLSAAVYWLTHNFYVAIYGVLLAFALGAFALLNLLVMSAPVPRAMRWLLVFAIVLAPVYLNKSVDYVGVMPALFFFLLALFFYRHSCWPGFFAAVGAGYLVRDNILMLLALPAGVILLEFLSDPRKAIHTALKLMPGILAVLAIAAAARLFVPLGWLAQRHSLYDLHRFTLSGFLLPACVGLGVTFSFLIFFRTLLSTPVRSARDKYQGLFLLGLLILVNVVFVRGRLMVPMEAPYPLDLKVTGYVLSGFDLLALLLAFRNAAFLPLKNPVFFVQIVGIVGVSLRGSWWDYYFLEFILLSLLLALSEKSSAQEQASGHLAVPRWAMGILCVLVIGEAGYVIYYKKVVVRAEQTLALLEPLYRSHDITPQNMKYMPFGYAGWYLFEPYLKQSPRDFGIATAMTNENGPLRLRIAFHERDTNPEQCRILRSGKSFMLGLSQYYAITQCPGALSEFPVISPARFFPMNNREWDSYING